MSELQNDSFIIDSNKQFRIRVTGYLCGLGVHQIVWTKEYLEIVLLAGKFSIRIGYPNKIEELSEIIKNKLLEETQLGIKDINNISYFLMNPLIKLKYF